MTEKNTVLIKKYGNRRLYDTETSQYITLDDLAQIVKTGRDIQVIDAKSQKDLTKSVLLQIITEREKDHDMIPVSFLKKVIQLSDQNIRDSLHRYLRVSMDAFLGAQKEFEERYRTFAGTFMNPLNANPMMWPMSFMSPPEKAPPLTFSPVAESSPRASGTDVTDTPSSATAEEQLQRLQKQMSQMQDVIAQLQKK